MAAGWLLYNDTTKYDIVYCDDNIFVQDYYPINKSMDNLWSVFKKTMGTSYYRPVLAASFIIDTHFALEKQFPNVNPDLVNPRSIKAEVYRRTNLIIHVLASALIFLFLFKLGYPLIASFLFGLLAVVHPILTPSAAWISGRNDSLLTIFLLASFISAIFYFEARKTYSAAISYVFHLLFFLLALFTKEITAFFPFVVFAYVVLYDKKIGYKNPKYIALAAGEFIAGLFWFFMRLQAIANIKNPDNIGLDVVPINLPTVPALVGKFFFPIKMIALSSYEAFSIGAGIIIIIAVFVYVFKSKKIDKEKAWFGIVWFILLLLPTMLIRIAFVDDFFDYAEHRAYSIMVGMMIFILEVLRGLKVDFKKPIPIAVFSVIIVLFAYKSYAYKSVFQNRKTFWSHMVEMYPYKSRGYLDLGKAYLSADQLDTAAMLYKKGIERNPKNKNLYIDMAALNIRKGDYKKAVEWAKKALKIDPQNAIAYYNLSRALILQNKFAEARPYLEFACRDPRYPDWHKDLGDVYFKLGNLNRAIIEYRKAIQGNKLNLFAYNNLGLVYYNLRKFDMAERVLLEAFKINPNSNSVVTNLLRVALAEKNLGKIRYYLNETKKRKIGLPPDVTQALVKLQIPF